MSSSAVTYLVYASLALPAAGASAWALYRCAGPLVLDAMDADEMLTAAVHRLLGVGYALFALGVAVAMGPNAHDLRAGPVSALASAWAGLLILLGLCHLAGLAIFARMRATRRARDLGPPRWYAGPTSAVGANPPVFSAPPPFLPPNRGWAAPAGPRAGAPAAFNGGPAFAPPPAFGAPPPPPWCSPVPLTFDPWAPPRR